MIKLYKYVYSFNPKDIAQYNGVFHVEEFLVKEEKDFNELDGWKIDCKNTYWFANIDDGISKDAVDDWKELEYHNNGRHGWSFKNDKETMEKFQNIIKGYELKNLKSFEDSVKQIKKRIATIEKSMTTH